MDGYAGDFAGGVEEGHLEAGAEGVIPHEVEGRLTDNAVGVVDAAPGVVLDGFAVGDGAVVEGEADDFGFGPAVDVGAFHFSAHAVDHGDDEEDAFDVGDFCGGGHRVLLWGGSGWGAWGE